MKIRKLSVIGLALVCIVLLFGCNQSDSVNANTEISPAPEQVEVANTKSAPEPPKTTEVKPEPKKFGVLTSNPEELKARFNPVGGVKSNLYEATYLSKSTGQSEVGIMIVATEGEVIGVVLQLVPLSKAVMMFRMSKNKKIEGTAVSHNDGSIGMTKDAQVTKCLNGAQKVVGAYERDLKVSDVVLKKFWLNDCGNLPVGFLMPLDQADLDSAMKNLDI